MIVSRIFYLSVIIGLCSGVSVMFVANGMLGYVNLKDSLIAATIMGGIGIYTLNKLRKKIKLAWGNVVSIPVILSPRKK